MVLSSTFRAISQAIRPRLAGLCVCLALVAAACGGATAETAASSDGSTVDGRPTVVVTTNILGDVVSNLVGDEFNVVTICLLYTSPSPRDGLLSRMPSSA